MQTETITQAPWDTVSLASAKRHLRITHGEWDNELGTETIPSAIQFCEIESGRTLRTAVKHRSTYRCWGELSQSLPWQPVLAIEGVTYIGENGVAQVLDVDAYRLVRSAGAAAVIELDSDAVLPTVADRLDAIRVDWSSGYGSIEEIPPLAKQAVKLALMVFWGDLDADEVEKWMKATRDALERVNWGFY